MQSTELQEGVIYVGGRKGRMNYIFRNSNRESIPFVILDPKDGSTTTSPEFIKFSHYKYREATKEERHIFTTYFADDLVTHKQEECYAIY